MTLSPLKTGFCEQGSSFDQLSRVFINIRNSHSIHYIITKVDNEIPIDT